MGFDSCFLPSRGFCSSPSVCRTQPAPGARGPWPVWVPGDSRPRPAALLHALPPLRGVSQGHRPSSHGVTASGGRVDTAGLWRAQCQLWGCCLPDCQPHPGPVSSRKSTLVFICGCEDGRWPLKRQRWKPLRAFLPAPRPSLVSSLVCVSWTFPRCAWRSLTCAVFAMNLHLGPGRLWGLVCAGRGGFEDLGADPDVESAKEHGVLPAVRSPGH